MLFHRQVSLLGPKSGGGAMRSLGWRMAASPPSPMLQTKQQGQRTESSNEDTLISAPPSCSHASAEEFLRQHLVRMYEERSPAPGTPSHLGSFPEALGGASHGKAFTLGDDVRFHRRLSSRFTSACDQEKLYGTAEVAFDTVHRDVALRLQWAREALRLLQSAIAQQSPCGSAAPRRLVVLVLYSHTQHDAAVGLHMKRIRDIVKAMLTERHNDVLGVLTVAVGVKWRSLAVADRTAAAAVAPTASAAATALAGKKKDGGHQHSSHDDDVLWYPNAGLYTFNALMQCLCSVGRKPDTMGVDCSSLQMHRKILIVSEGWFHVRTTSELHGPKDATRIAPGGDTVDVEPLPFVLGSAHSERELQQFARYTACRALTP